MATRSEFVGLRPYQMRAKESIISGFNSFRKQLAVLPTGCHAAGHPILMADGTIKPVETVQIGEQVMGPDSQPRTVLELHTGEEEMFEVIPIKGEPFIVNSGHILRLKRTRTGKASEDKQPWNREISVTDWLKTSKTFRHLHKLERFGVEFPGTSFSERILDPYLLGVLLGDGCLHQHQIMVCTPDKEIVRELTRFAQIYGARLRVSHMHGNAASNYYFAGKERGHQSEAIKYFVNALGLTVSGEHKFVPDGYRRAEREVRMEVLAGLLDTDGHLSRCGYEFSSKSLRLAEDVVFIARSLGLAAYRSQKPVKGEIYQRVTISGDCSKIPVRIKRKKSPERKQIKDHLLTGFTVRPIGRGTYHGFTLDGDHLYLDGNFTVHHNSGKTILFSSIAEHYRPGRTLVLAHREELILQAVDKIRTATGMEAEVEMGDERASLSAPVVVGSIQTMLRDHRRERFPRDHFTLVIVDEAHRILAESYLNTLAYYDQHALILGVTATADRGDKRSLGSFFENLAYEVNLLELIQQNWLCPIKVKTVPLGMDLRGVGSSHGDYRLDDLGHAIEPYLERVADIMAEHRERKSIVFLPLVALSAKFAGMLRERGLSAEHIDGTSIDRREILDRFAKDQTRVLTNAMLLTEGYDEPSIDCVVCLRPTKIRSLYSQMVGRGTRIYPGKDHLLLLDFLWMSGEHNLIKPAHLIAQDDEDAARISRHLTLDLEGDLGQAKEAADRDLAANLRRRLEDNRNRRARTFDVLEFALSINDMALADFVPTMPWHGQVATPKQLSLLARFGFDIASIQNKGHAAALITRLFERRELGLATPKQVRVLRSMGYEKPELATFDEASAFLNARLKPAAAAA